jgi:polyphosphate kinase
MSSDFNQFITDPIVSLGERMVTSVRGIFSAKVNNQIRQSDYFSRDLSWMQFNYRVLDQARSQNRSLFDRLRFLAITASNFDEFFMIRVGSLYNYIDYGKERVDYSGLREKPFKQTLLAEAQQFYRAQYDCFLNELVPRFAQHSFQIADLDALSKEECEVLAAYFRKTIYPMLTPMMLDVYHTFPIMMSKAVTLAVVTQNKEDVKNPRRITFVQIPQNLARFYTLEREDELLFIPIERIIRWQIDKLFRNIEILSVDTFRIMRNGDVSIEESDDVDIDFVDEVKRKLNGRRTGRIVRVEMEQGYSPYVVKTLRERWDLENDNFFIAPSLLDLTGLTQITSHPEFLDETPPQPQPVRPLSWNDELDRDMFESLKQRDVLLHHPYNSMEPVLKLLEMAAEDVNVLSIKMTIYRLAKDSRIINALLRAAENGKNVSVLFEVKARFDEENNIREAKRLQKAGCFVIYGVGRYKTHCKMMLIVRKDVDRVTRYVHLSTGNYNEVTSRFYTDISLLTTNEIYANDVSEFFNVITGHSLPERYQYLITAPRELRNRLIDLIRREAENARNGEPAAVCIKVNSLEDMETINELYKASQAGVVIRLIIRGICCLRPGRKGLSENITVTSLVGDYLEHARIYYFHNAGAPAIYGGSADMMNRSFDRRVESLFLITDPKLQAEAINILLFNCMDNVNTYVLTEEGEYLKTAPLPGQAEMNTHKAFYEVDPALLVPTIGQELLACATRFRYPENPHHTGTLRAQS